MKDFDVIKMHGTTIKIIKKLKNIEKVLDWAMKRGRFKQKCLICSNSTRQKL
jgi:hypothetical protein